LAGVDSARSHFASNIPGTWNGGTILSLTEGNATTAGFQLDGNIETFVFTSQSRDRTGAEARGAKRVSARLESPLPSTVTSTMVFTIVSTMTPMT